MIFFDIFKFLLFLIVVPIPVGAVLHQVFFPKEKISLLNSLTLGLLASTLSYFSLLHIFGHQLSPHLQVLISIACWLLLGLKKHLTSFFFPLPGLPATIFILLSVYINSLLLVPFGELGPSGVALSGAHFIDSTWHLSLINSLITSFPPDNPLFTGVPLSNYHYLVDLLAAFITQVTDISVSILFFKILGPFLLLLLSLHIFTFLKKITGRELAGIAGLILIMLSSNLYYLVGPFFPDASLTPSVAWIEFFSSKTVNFPLLISLSMVIVFMDVVERWEKPNVIQAVLFGILSGGLFGFKSHTAVVWLSALGLITLRSLTKKHFTYLISCLFAVGVIWLFSSGMVSSGSTTIQFQPLWYIRVMFESPDHFNYPLWELKRQTLIAGESYLGIAKLYTQGLFWFIVVNFGFSIFGVITFLSGRLSPKLKLIFTAFIVSGLGLTLSFVLSSIAIVTIQFAYLALIAFSIQTAILLGSISRKQNLLALSILVLLWALLLPGVRQVASGYQNTAQVYNYGPEFIEIVNFLKLQPPKTIVMVEPELWSGSFIPGFTGQHLFLGDPQILQGLFINYSSRQADTLNFLNCQNTSIPVDYILVSKGTNLSRCAQLVFSTEKYEVYFNENNPHNKLP